MPKKRISSFKEFWPFYLNQHRNPINRILHRVGATLSVILIPLFITYKLWWCFLIVPFVGYSFAWYGHFFIEKNKPATFDYPFWSFIADFKMLAIRFPNDLPKEQ